MRTEMAAVFLRFEIIGMIFSGAGLISSEFRQMVFVDITLLLAIAKIAHLVIPFIQENRKPKRGKTANERGGLPEPESSFRHSGQDDNSLSGLKSDFERLPQCHIRQ